MTTTPRPCPCCGTPRDNPRHYLCRTCWSQLPSLAQGRLNRRDAYATLRVIELNRQINAGVPLSEIRITR